MRNERSPMGLVPVHLKQWCEQFLRYVWIGIGRYQITGDHRRCSGLPLPTIPSFQPGSKPHRDCMADPLPLLTGLPTRPTHSNRARFDRRCPHTHGRRAPRHCDFAAFNLSCVCEAVPCDNQLAYAGDSTFPMIVDCLPVNPNQGFSIGLPGRPTGGLELEQVIASQLRCRGCGSGHGGTPWTEPALCNLPHDFSWRWAATSLRAMLSLRLLGHPSESGSLPTRKCVAGRYA